MSDTTPTQSAWILDDLAENMDVRTDEKDKIVEIREHFVIQVHKQIRASEIPANGDIGVKMATISYTVGGVNVVKNPPKDGGPRFMCIADGVSPVAHPGEWCYRRQTWESFGKYITPTPGWLAP